jgi:hypothetical protein
VAARGRGAPFAALALGLALALLPALGAAAADAPAAGTAPGAAGLLDKYAGTYRIDGWRDLEARGLYHFFYLAPDGRFLLAAEWPGKERSLFVGTWSIEEDRLALAGAGHVETNQGAWRSAFERSYRIQVEAGGFVLAPEPVKNHYGLLGWPQAYRYFRRQPAPNLPQLKLPDDPAALERYIGEQIGKQKQ